MLTILGAINTHYSMFDLSGRTALVTGGSQGIGAAIAIALAGAGARVLVNHREHPRQANDVVGRIQAAGGSAVRILADVGAPGAPASIFSEATAHSGTVDILVTCVAVQRPAPWGSVTPGQFDEQVRVNWQSAFELIQLAAPGMLERGWGRILTIGSVQEAKPHPEMIVYAALKSAQTSMVRNLARQFASRGVTVNNLAPGVIDTPRSRARLADPEYARRVVSAIPAGRIGQPEECVGAALLLCSDAGAYITGQSLFVDGGMSL